MLRLPLQNPHHAWGDPPGPDETDPYALLPEPLAEQLKLAVRSLAPVPATARPCSPLTRPLAECRVTLLSDAGLAPDGDFGGRSWLPLPADGPRLTTGAETAESYDGSAVRLDNSVALPRALLTELQLAGKLGAATPLHISLAATPMFHRTRHGRRPTGVADMKDEDISAIAQCLGEQGTDLLIAAATTPTGLDRLAKCLARLEAGGITTLLVNPWWPATKLLPVSRSVALFMPPGRPLGDAGWHQARLDILLALLQAAARNLPPGAVLHLPQSWPWPVADDCFMPVRRATRPSACIYPSSM